MSWLDKYYAGKIVATAKKYILRTRARKLKNVTFLHFKTTLHKYAFKIETGCATKPNLETRSVKDKCEN